MATELSGREEFVARIRTQIQARYRDLRVDGDRDRFALHLSGPGVSATLPLGPLYNSCVKAPERTSSLIAEYVRTVERQMSPRDALALVPSQLLWCVRAEAYLQSLQRADELITRPLGGDLVAFLAENLPGQIMRGVPAGDLEAAGIGEAQAHEAADHATARRFAHLPERIRGADRVPADGWRLASDQLFQGSVLLVPAILAAFAERAGGEVLIGVPDRSMLLAIPASLPNADRFQMRVTRNYREAMNPCSRTVLVTDGASLREQTTKKRSRTVELLPWIRD
jgi:hypothetical protein